MQNENPDIAIISGLLQGQYDFIDFVSEIKKINKLPRLIIIMDRVDTELNSKLFSLGIFDVFYDDKVDVPDIIEAIDREEPITKKIATVRDAEKEKYNAEEKIEKVYVTKTQKQEIIAVSGINGAGKSTVVKNLAKTLEQKTSAKILVVDFDTLNGNIDELFAINKVPQNVELLMDEDKKCGINYVAELISKNRFDSNVFEELVIKSGSIDIITGNTSLHFCQNVLNETHYEKILEVAKEKYDFIIFDTSSNIFLDSTKWILQKANRIFFVTENNYISLKKSNQLLNIYLNTWGVLKKKVQVVINKESKDGLEIELMQSILGDIDIIGSIKLSEQENEISYERILQTIDYIPKITLIDKMKDSIEQIIKKGQAYNLAKNNMEASHAN